MATFESATSRVSRLLTMVPWLLNRQGIDLAQAATELGVTQRQVVQDLEVLFVCGLPGHYPDDLIEAAWEDGKVFVSNADTIARPLRLTRDEALALIVALQALRATPGLTEHAALDRALEKLRTAAGAEAAAAESVQVELEQPLDEQQAADLRTALTQGRRLHLSYTSAAQDETTARDVDPIRVVSVDGRWYLEGWCHRAQGARLFRLDRINSLRVLDVPAAPPEELPARDLSEGVFQPGPEHASVTLSLMPEAAWVAQTFPVEEVVRHDDGTLTVQLRVANLRWLHRLIWRTAGGVRLVGPRAAVDELAQATRAALNGHRSHQA